MAVEAIVDELRKMSTTVESSKQIEQVAVCSANQDVEIGKKLAEAMDKVGKDGVITVEEGQSLETTVDLVEGMQFDKGYLSPHFVNNLENDVGRARQALHPGPREEDQLRQVAGPAAGEGGQAGQASADHRRGRRGRGAGDAGGEQAARRAAGGGGQGPRLRRPAQGPAQRYRRADRRRADLRGPGPAIWRTSSSSSSAGPSRSRSTRTTRRSSKAAAAPRRSRAGSSRSRPRSTSPPAITTSRSCRSGWPSSPAASPRSTSARPPRPR